MDIQHTFEVYQKQFENLRRSNHHGRPQVLRQYRMQFKGFSKQDIEKLKEFLLDNEKKWFVAHLLDHLDSFPLELLQPMLNAAVDEPDPSFNRFFIEPCRRVFDYVDVQKILLDIFCNGDKDKKIGVLKSLYWARRTVYKQTVKEGPAVYQQRGHDTFFWDGELQSFSEDFKDDEELFNKEAPRQEEAYNEQIRTILEEFYRSNDIKLKYQISLRLPKKMEDFPKDLQEQAKQFITEKKSQGIPHDMFEFEKVQNMKYSFARRLLLSITRMFRNQDRITLKQK
jgi:hypothetical protein